MANNQESEKIPVNRTDTAAIGADAFSWSFPEFTQHNHSRRWWIWFIFVSLGLLAFALLTANFLFALIIIIITGIIIFREYHGADEITCAISDDGIEINGRRYAWNEIEKFWFAYEPPEIKELYIKFKSLLTPSLTIPLQDINPMAVRELLSQYAEEDLGKEGQPTSEALGRLLKL